MTVGTVAALVVVGGGVTGVVALTGPEPQAVTAMDGETPSGGHVPAREAVALPPDAERGLGDAAAPARVDSGPPVLTGDRTSHEADRTATRAPRQVTGRAVAAYRPRPVSGSTSAASPSPAAASPSPAAAATPVSGSTSETETRPIPFRTTVVPDSSLAWGSKRLRTAGVPGEETMHYLVTYVAGKETGRHLVDSGVTRDPQDRVIAVGSGGGSGDGSDGRSGDGSDGRSGDGSDGRSRHGSGGRFRDERRRDCGLQLGRCLLGRTGPEERAQPGATEPEATNGALLAVGLHPGRTALSTGH